MRQRGWSDNFCYRKDGNAITKWGALDKKIKYCYHTIRKFSILIGYQKLFRILGSPIIVWLTVYSVISPKDIAPANSR